MKTMTPVLMLLTSTYKTAVSLVFNTGTVKQRVIYFTYIIIFFLLFFSSVNLLFAQSDVNSTEESFFAKGLDAFKWQKTDEAINFFEKAAAQEPENDKIYLFLGYCLQEKKDYLKAEEAFTEGININGREKELLVFSRANMRAESGSVENAVSDYNSVIAMNGTLKSPAMLNLANIYLNNGKLQEALDSYNAYMSEYPDNPQKDNIARLISLLSNRLVSEAEAARLAAEQAKAEEERKKALMEEVQASLNESGKDTKSITAGSEKIMEDLEDSALEE